MIRIIGVTELQRSFRAVLDEGVKRGIPYVLTRQSRPEAALIPYEEFLRYQDLKEREILDRYDRLRDRMMIQNAAYSEEEIEADIRAAREGR